MAYTYHDVTVVYAITSCVSLVMFLLRISQQINIHRQRQQPLKRADIVGSGFFFLSMVIIITSFSLQQKDIMGKAAAGDKTFTQNGMEVTYDLLISVNKRNFVTAFINPLALWCIKFSYLSTYWGISSHLKPVLKTALRLITVYMIVSYVIIAMIALLWCRPLSQFWTFNGTYTRCFTIGFWDFVPFTIQFALILTTDLSLMLFSVALVRSLYIQRHTELWAIALIFFIGFMSVISTIMRYYYNHAITKGTSTSEVQQFQYSISLLVWQVLELLFATVSYGLTSARAYLRFVVRSIKSAQSYLSSRLSIRSKLWGSSYGSSHIETTGTKEGEDVVHLTKSAGTKSEILAQGHSFPEFELQGYGRSNELQTV